MLIALVGADRLIKKLLHALQGLDAAEELPPHRGSSRKSLSQDIADLSARFPEQVSVEAIAILLEHVITERMLPYPVVSSVNNLSSHQRARVPGS